VVVAVWMSHWSDELVNVDSEPWGLDNLITYEGFIELFPTLVFVWKLVK
jgi:hypothetical protein